MFYSKSTGGFYLPEIHGDNIPQDSVEISDDYHAEMMEGQTSGLIISADDNGYPILVERPEPTPEEAARQSASKKSALIAEASDFIAPLADAKAGGYIDDEDLPRLDNWQRYRYNLTKVDVKNPVWPDKPE